TALTLPFLHLMVLSFRASLINFRLTASNSQNQRTRLSLSRWKSTISLVMRPAISSLMSSLLLFHGIVLISGPS
ncbi:hypothetical protein CISIN_1g0195701mg, partial [Citrus sinensis]